MEGTPLAWRHPCFEDLLGASDFLPPCHRTAAKSPDGSEGFTVPLHLAATLLEQVVVQLEPAEVPAVSATVSALQFGAQLAKAAPADPAAWTPKLILRLLQQVVAKLRGMKEGEMVVVPAGWTSAAAAESSDDIDAMAAAAGVGGGSVGGNLEHTAQHKLHQSSLLLALRRRTEALWDVAVCTASAGREYHPSYRLPLCVSDDAFDPVLMLHGVPTDRLVDSAPWLALYRGVAVAYPTYEEGARYVYEVLLPFFVDEPLPRAVARSPPPACFRRAPTPTRDRALMATTLESVCGLLCLHGCSPTVAKRIELQMRATYLRHVESQLAALADGVGDGLSDTDGTRVRAACRGLARCTAAQGEHSAPEGAASDASLLGTSALIRRVVQLTDELLARGAGFIPPRILAANAAEASASAFPFFGRLLRYPASVEGLAGLAPPPPSLRAVQLTAVSEALATPHEVVVAMQAALYECTLLASQESLIPNSACLRVALLQHLVTETIPLPLPVDHPERASACFWAAAPIRYETQLQLMRLLSLLLQHHAVASLCLKLTRELDAARIITAACLAAIADAVMRIRAIDSPSALADHYAGRAGGPSAPFGVDHDPFAAESETLKFPEPALLIARGMVLDYFASLRRIVPPLYRLFGYEQPDEFGGGELRLVAQICAQVGFPVEATSASAAAGPAPAAPSAPPNGGGGGGGGDAAGGDERVRGSALPLYLTGELPDLLLLYPELAAFRDLIFVFKLFMCPEQAMLPARGRWRPADARLTWSHAVDEKRAKKGFAPALSVAGFGTAHLNLGLAQALRGDAAAQHANVFQEWINRFGLAIGMSKGGSSAVGRQPRAPPSGANPSGLLRSPKLKLTSEDSILSLDSQRLLSMQGPTGPGANGGEPSGAAPPPLKSQRSAGGGIGNGSGDERPPLSARDAELLLTYLTAPYLRIPLLLGFFADQQRLHALSSVRMQEVLEAALFEPGAWHGAAHRPPPTHVPPTPEERAIVLATPLGLLFNELVHAPTLLLDPLERLLDMALDLDTGAHDGPSARILYFVTRLIVHVESHALLLIQHARWRRSHRPQPAPSSTHEPTGADTNHVVPSTAPSGPGAIGATVSRDSEEGGTRLPPPPPNPPPPPPPPISMPSPPTETPPPPPPPIWLPPLPPPVRTAESSESEGIDTPSGSDDDERQSPGVTSHAHANEDVAGSEMPSAAATLAAGPHAAEVAAATSSDVGKAAPVPPPPAATNPPPPASAHTDVSPAVDGDAAPPTPWDKRWRVYVRGLDSAMQADADGEAMEVRVAAMRRRLDEHVFPLFEKWFARSSKQKDVKSACVISAHLAVLLKNVTPEQMDARAVTTLLASHVFLTHNFAWDAEKPTLRNTPLAAAAASSTTANSASGTPAPPPGFTFRRGGSVKKRRAPSDQEHELGMPQTVVFDLFQRHRRTILARLRAHPVECAQAMEAVTRVVTFTGTRVHGYKHLGARTWVEMDAERNSGRFTVVERPMSRRPAVAIATDDDPPPDGRPLAAVVGVTPPEEPPDVASAPIAAGEASSANGDSASAVTSGSPLASESYEAWLAKAELQRSGQQEINVQLGEYCASSHKQMRVLPPELVAGFADFDVVFGGGSDALSYQSAEVQATSARTWVRLVGQRHDLQRWAPDMRTAPPSFATPYRGLLPTLTASLPWVHEILEPVREAHFPALTLTAPAAELAIFRNVSSMRVLLLEAKASLESTGIEKEVLIVREPPLVMVFNLVEHGRRWYRSLVFASDASCCLAALPASVALHRQLPALVCGDALTPSPPAPSLVISRSTSVLQESDGTPVDAGEQTFLPTRLLRGLLPAALLELYVFWQHERDDSIVAFPSATLLGEPAVEPTVLHLSLSAGACALRECGTTGPNAAATVRRHRVVPAAPAAASATAAHTAGGGVAWHTQLMTESRTGVSLGRSERSDGVASWDDVHIGGAGSGGIEDVGGVGDGPIETDGEQPFQPRRDRPKRSLPLDHVWRRLGGASEVLLDLLHAPEGSALARLATIFRRLDDLSHVLAWAVDPNPPAIGSDDPPGGTDHQLPNVPPALRLIELPRLRLSFEVRAPSSASATSAADAADATGGAGGDGSLYYDSASGTDGLRIYCREHASFFITNARPAALGHLLHGLPHAVVLQAEDGELAVLVSAAAKPIVTAKYDEGGMGGGGSAASVASTTSPPSPPDVISESGIARGSRCVLQRSDTHWLANLPQARHYMYPVHPSQALLSSPSLAASLYLLLMLLVHGRYPEAIRLVEACSTDRALTQEEAQLWTALSQLVDDDDAGERMHPPTRSPYPSTPARSTPEHLPRDAKLSSAPPLLSRWGQTRTPHGSSCT